ncbi:hypothetical protein KGF56_004571 [Candida oxycetoniae]|uniref:Endonuclease/exonuclease/phosphatase domain-containing protein n=1 Tax=Candida oxycetoniae TaxID=497107 RepID=A0AAI9STE8_9ASCO|nr:uncharacterized protein KGF56_004571 [Candida oxycetoniae]KAI3402690.1 hypothetical protein KGF56_004571 [Candida oxycetoniae]
MTNNEYDVLKYRSWVLTKETTGDSSNSSSKDDDDDSSSSSSGGRDDDDEGGRKFSVMSYNLLSRHYIWKHVYSKLPKDHLDWDKHRFPLINKTIRHLKCDIMCFQEMEYSIYKSFWSRDFPSSDYQSFYVQKSSLNQGFRHLDDGLDGVGIFVNTRRFEVLGERRINFGQIVMENKEKYNLTTDLMKRLVPRNTVALALRLYDKQAKRVVFVANTHLYWSPKFNDVKVLQTKLLLNELESFINGEEDTCVILLGDLNSNPQSDVYKLLRGNKIDTLSSREFLGRQYGKNNALISQEGEITNPFNFLSVYEPFIKSNHLHFTSFSPTYCGVIDHILVSNEMKIHKVLGEVDQNYFKSLKMKGFPNSQFPSDHIPIAAEISYSSKRLKL